MTTDHRQRTYTVRLGSLTADVRGLSGLCALLPLEAVTELRARSASFYTMLSNGGGFTTLRLASLPGVALHVRRHDSPLSTYLIEVWRGRTINARTIDGERLAAWEILSLTQTNIISAGQTPIDAAMAATVAHAISSRLPSIRSRLSNEGSAYIQWSWAEGISVGVRITRKELKVRSS